MSETQDAVVVERPRPDLAILRLNRGARMNAMDVPAMSELAQLIDRLEQDTAVRVLILTGTGKGFCAGLDLKSVLDEGGRLALDVTQAYRLQECFEGVVRRLRASHKTVIAAVNGVAVGAGFALALAADIRLAVAEAAFHVGAVRVGLSAGECGISYHLPRLVGASRAFELMLTGRPVDSGEAERIGLVSAVVPAQDLLARALECASQVLRNSPYSTQHTKRLMWSNLDAPSLEAALELENHTQVLALMTADFAEAAQAFAHKRAPVFRGC